MLQFDEYKVKLNNLAPTLKELAAALDLESAERELDMLQAESAADGFWDNLAKAQKVQQRIKTLQDKVDSQAKRQGQWDDLMALCEMGNEFEDESLVPELEEGYAKLEADMETARLQTLLTGVSSRVRRTPVLPPPTGWRSRSSVVSPSPPPSCSSSTTASASTSWTPPVTRTSLRIPTAL